MAKVKPGENQLSVVAPVACMYSAVCLLCWNLYWCLNPVGLEVSDVRPYFVWDALTARNLPRFDHLVSRIATGVFLLSCLVQAERMLYYNYHRISTMSVYCNEYINMIALTSHLLMSVDFLAPTSISLNQRVVYTARLGEWIASTPLLLLMVMSFDVRFTTDWVRVVFYSLMLQSSVVAASISSLTTNQQLSYFSMIYSLVTFLFLFVLLAETYYRYTSFNAEFSLLKRSDANYFRENLLRIGISKSMYAVVFCCIFYVCVFVVQALGVFHIVTHSSEFLQLTSADVMVELVFAYVLSIEHIRLIFEENLMHAWEDVRTYFEPSGIAYRAKRIRTGAERMRVFGDVPVEAGDQVAAAEDPVAPEDDPFTPEETFSAAEEESKQQVPME